MPHLSLTDKEKEGEYPYELAACAYLFNRSDNQVKFLFDLCDKNLEHYIQAELALKRLLVPYCPGTRRELYKLLTLDRLNSKPLKPIKGHENDKTRGFFDAVNWY